MQSWNCYFVLLLGFDLTLMSGGLQRQTKTHGDGRLNLRGEMDGVMQGPRRLVNGKYLDMEGFYAELHYKSHDLVGEMITLPFCGIAVWGPLHSRCISNFSGLEEGKSYRTLRSEVRALHMHMNKFERPLIDLSPLVPASILFGIGFVVKCITG